jgi:hypothetical protein
VKLPQSHAQQGLQQTRGGHELREAGVILAGDLSGQKARLELMAALGVGLREEELRTHFERYARRSPPRSSTAAIGLAVRSGPPAGPAMVIPSSVLIRRGPDWNAETT